MEKFRSLSDEQREFARRMSSMLESKDEVAITLPWHVGAASLLAAFLLEECAEPLTVVTVKTDENRVYFCSMLKHLEVGENSVLSPGPILFLLNNCRKIFVIVDPLIDPLFSVFFGEKSLSVKLE